ncbi:MAG: hypothetical protein AB1468_05375 [Candidatus Micrarchaeota archaeon]
MGEYKLEFARGWEGYFEKLDRSMQERVWRKIQQLKTTTYARHLKKGLPFYVSEIGQYRPCYTIDEKKKIKVVYFVGDHKEYEKWLGL